MPEKVVRLSLNGAKNIIKIDIYTYDEESDLRSQDVVCGYMLLARDGL